MSLLPRNPIRWVAVIVVGITSGYIMWMGYRLSNILASPEWCGKALQAEKISSQSFGGLTACVDLLKIQLNAISHVDLVYSGVIALCLLALIVIVIAKGDLDLTIPGGGSVHVGKGPVTTVAKAVTETAAAAVNKAAEITAEEPTAQAAPGEDG